MEEEEKDFDFFSCVYAHNVGSSYDFYLGPPPRLRLCEIQVQVFCDVNQWHAIHTQNPLWNQLPPEVFEMIALELFYWETKYQCERCKKIFNQPEFCCCSR
jgi:hypothetical protein